MSFEISEQLQMYLKRLTSKATVNVPEIQNFNATSFLFVIPGDTEDVNQSTSLLYSADDGEEFNIYGAHIDGTQATQITFVG